MIEWRAALLEGGENVARARQVVQKLVDERVVFTPEVQANQPGYRVLVPATRARLVAAALNVDEATVVHAVESPQPAAASIELEKPGPVHEGTSPTGFEPVFWP